MKYIITIFIGCIILVGVIVYVENGEVTMEEGNNSETSSEVKEQVKEEDSSSAEEELNEGQHQLKANEIYSWIGENALKLKGEFGEPNRVDITPYNYEWWVYDMEEIYIQFGVREDAIVTVFTNHEAANIGPIQLGESYEYVQEYYDFNEKVSLHGQYRSFQFELNEEELLSRPMAAINNEVWAQFYFDVYHNELSSIRYVDQETLLLQQPYDIVFRGDMPESKELTDDEWKKVEEGQAKQVLALTNKIRERHGLQPLEWDDSTAYVAYLHSYDMYQEGYFSHTSPNYGELKDRLEGEDVLFQLAAENIAAYYVDAIGAVEGWLNSEGHRINLLHEDFTHLGVGVYRDYYTQNFLTPR
ncbi:CAP domain-containing protein [Evansella cellulosilytica]|uniref:SCP-like extracellular n=1 Tax=Evansella cellulosilytica (strain ATCC 21833 / DSM 2522 / FERM P-1141 / JCM 9156 / N-4) TaxID=649639 RepID=E6TUJ0_EVAC2|nr:CAP domain-containing protein [Evansella cellulosilytica]ADU30880.1 SCP-like extracellular [Evansella cellulosilytica DSM 2522]